MSPYSYLLRCFPCATHTSRILVCDRPRRAVTASSEHGVYVVPVQSICAPTEEKVSKYLHVTRSMPLKLKVAYQYCRIALQRVSITDHTRYADLNYLMSTPLQTFCKAYRCVNRVRHLHPPKALLFAQPDRIASCAIAITITIHRQTNGRNVWISNHETVGEAATYVDQCSLHHTCHHKRQGVLVSAQVEHERKLFFARNE